MDVHVKQLGLYNFLFGLISLLLIPPLLIYLGGFTGLYNLAGDLIVAVVIASAIAFHLLLAIPCILFGYLVQKYSEVARSGLIIVSALNLLNLPFGSILGGYGLWVLLSEETEPLFSKPASQINKAS